MVGIDTKKKPRASRDDNLYIPKQSLTFILIPNILFCRSVMFFHRVKEPKRPAHGKNSRPYLCSGAALRHPSVEKVLPAKPFIRFLGDADLPQLATAYSGI
jgi:hypothetical protein